MSSQQIQVRQDPTLALYAGQEERTPHEWEEQFIDTWLLLEVTAEDEAGQRRLDHVRVVLLRELRRLDETQMRDTLRLRISSRAASAQHEQSASAEREPARDRAVHLQ